MAGGLTRFGREDANYCDERVVMSATMHSVGVDFVYDVLNTNSVTFKLKDGYLSI